MIRKFDLRHSPAALYDGESLSDLSGNGLHLTGPSALIRQVYGNALGLSPSGALSRNGVSDAVLRDYDGMTLHALLVLRAAPSATWLCSFSAAGDAEAANYLWSIQLTSSNTLTYFTEHGAGVDLAPAYVAAPAGRGLPALGVPFYLALRLKAVTGGLEGQFFVNGAPFGAPSGVLVAPTGGTSGQLLINQGASAAFDLLGLEVDNAPRSDAELRDYYDHLLGDEFGPLVQAVRSLWVGGLRSDGVTVVARLDQPSDAARLSVTGPSGTVYSSAVDTSSLAPSPGSFVRLSITGLDPDTEYSYDLEEHAAAIPEAPSGRFRTLPTGASSFTVAFAGDAASGSNHASFDAIRAKSPLFFLHLGDAHYQNIASNDPLLYHAAFDLMLSSPRQSQFFRELPCEYIWDDHDYGQNNSNASSASRPAATSVFRQRVPFETLVEAGPNGAVYRSFDVGRVRFVLTDQRSAASANAATDNASKTMLGTAQKAWFENILSNSAGMLIVWCCPRVFQQPPTAGSDGWGGFATERAELVSHIHAECPGRVVVLSADMHSLAIDDGSNHDYLPGGGEPLPTFQSSPLDIVATAATGTYSTGGPFLNNGQFGTMEITDTGGASIAVAWKGWDSSGTLLASHSFSVAV